MDDKKLIEYISHGDKNSFKQLFLKYYSPLCEYASRFVSNIEAEDIVDDLMLYIWECRSSITIYGSIKSYLFTAVKHKALNSIKKDTCHFSVHSTIYDIYKDKFDDPDYYLSHSELSSRIKHAIDKLKEDHKKTFILSRYEHKTNKEIAEILDISIKTVEYRITQSLKQLRIELSEFLG